MQNSEDRMHLGHSVDLSMSISLGHVMDVTLRTPKVRRSKAKGHVSGDDSVGSGPATPRRSFSQLLSGLCVLLALPPA